MGWCPGAAGLNDPNALYQLTLTKISRNIEDGKLVTASNSLLAVSHWLLSQVVELGLTSDGQSQYEEWKLWNDFYETWLAILQRQKDMMESGLQLQYGQTLVPEEGLKKIRDDLARLCDSIKQYNLYWKGRIVPGRCGRFPLHECVLLTMCCQSCGSASNFIASLAQPAMTVMGDAG
ncbi:hypothetical protein C8A05DRAFT_18030 [Staphylotrichum tortipilum]|uniref:Uncharacterized protein n=1 Tax=Staphylotrichum tortipilum TaxID=2831512 RepID=A0AAN6MER7_9PEZI|nr:hypothetical protein C8A05DRAFT_18030 [Staphylotrichum longicolle]